MRLGAIVVIGETGRVLAQKGPSLNLPAGARSAGTRSDALFAEPLGCVEIVGRSMTERMIERFLGAGIDTVSVLADAAMAYHPPPFRAFFKNVTVQVVSDLRSALAHKLSEYYDNGIEHSFVSSSDVYAETDLLDLYYFHREARQPVTRAFDRDGPLALWVADCAKAQQPDFEDLMHEPRRGTGSYFIRSYVNRLAHPRDLRRFAADTLRGRCESAPSGREVRPGIWIDSGAEVHRRARIVAPAYIGCGTKIREATLITRLSGIERNCSVDCGTVVEDSSILANTHVGIWLDVCHAVVKGNKLLSLGRDVVIEISDPSVMRSSNSVRRATAGVRSRKEEQVSAADLPKAHPTPGWQFGANLIEE